MRKSVLIFSALYAFFLVTTCPTGAMAADEPIVPQTELTEAVLSASSPEESQVVVPVECPEPEAVNDTITEADIELIALLTMAEAESECEEGKRLVIDTVLNRVDSEHYPDTVYDVIYQPYQFSPMWNGRIKRCEVREDICRLVREELESRLNHEVIFFTNGGYSAYGVPMFQVERHYFSSYD